MMPELDFPVVTTIVAYPGASPEDVVEQVTKPVEQAVANTPGLERLQSTSGAGISLVMAEFEFGTDTAEAESTIQSALSRVSLPENAQPPRTARININDLPVVQISLTGKVPLSELRQIAADRLAPELAEVEGVYSVDLVGGEQQQVDVLLDPEKAAEKGISFQQVAALLQANSLALPAGSVEVDGQAIPVRTMHRFQTLEDLTKVVVGVDREAVGGLLASGASTPAAATPPGAGGAPIAAGAAPQAPPAGTGQPALHVVQPGDTVSGLAERYGTTTRAIAQSNRLADPDLIFPGQKLMISRPDPAADVGSEGAIPPAGAPGMASQPQPSQPPPVKLGDIASVSFGPARTTGISRTNGEPSVLLMVSKTQDSNAVRVARNVTRRLEELKGQLGEGVETRVVVDESRFVESSLTGLGREGLLGMLFAVLVIFAFLWSPRGTLIAAVSIPLSIALAFLAMEWWGLTLNVMTLAGLAVAVGRVVDDGIVVLENAHRHVALGQTPATAARSATAEVTMPIVASTAATVAVFLPLGTVGGIVGQAFRPFAITVAVALVASLLVALTVVPVLCRLFIPARGQREAARERPLELGDLLADPEGPTAIGEVAASGNGRNGHHPDPWPLRLYTPLLRASLAHPYLTLLLAAALLAASLALIPGIPTSFLPSDEEKILIVQVVAPPGASREALSEKAAEVERVLGEIPGVTLYQTSLGDETGTMGSLRAAFTGRGSGTATIVVRLDEEADLENAAADLRDSLREVQGDGRISVATEQSMGTSRVRLVVAGQNQVDVDVAADRVERELEDLPGLANVTSDRARASAEISIQVEPSRAAELGLTTAQLAAEIRGMIAGQTVGRLEQGDGSLDIRLSVPKDAVDSRDRLGKLPFGSPRSRPLSEIAEIRQEERPVQITRVGQRPAVDISADTVTADTGAVSREVRERIASLDLPGGVSVDFGGVMQQISEGFTSMGTGQLVGVALVYLIMALFFNSLLDPLVILLSLPLAAVGALPALYFTDRPLSMSGMIGMLMLIGIVVTNAIVLLDFARREIDRGREPRQALLEAGRTRLRPILMTALTTILALAPLALGLEKGSIIAAELAVVVMGGLISSTFLTLLVVPAAYSLVRR